MAGPNGRRTERIAWSVVVLAVCGVLVVVGGASARRKADGVFEREEAAKETLRRVRSVELSLKARTGSFGWLDDLPPGTAVTPGYQVDVLLPRDQIGDRVLLTSRTEGDVHADLAKRHFALVARPLEPGVSGYRSWYVDERGEVYFSEGVTDLEALLRGSLPQWVVRGELGRETGAPVFWQRAPDTWD